MSHCTTVEDLRAVQAAVTMVCTGLDPDAVREERVREGYDCLVTMERLVTGARTRMQRRVAEAGVWHGGGDRNAAEFVARTTGTTRAQAKASLDTSRRLGGLEQVDAAVAAGQLSGEQATAVADAASADPEAQERLLEAAAKVSVSVLREEARRVKAAADADPEATRRRIHDRRFLRRWNDAEGAYNLALRNTAEVGAEVDALLQPFLDRVWRTARVQGRRESPDAYAADALVEALRGHDPAAEHDPAVQTAAAAGQQAGAQVWQARPANAQGGSGAQATPATKQGGEGGRAEPATHEGRRAAPDEGGRTAADEGGGVGLWEPSTTPVIARLPGGSPVPETGDLPPSRDVTEPGPGWEPWEPWQEGEPVGEPPLAWDGDQELGEPDIDATLARFSLLSPRRLVSDADEEPLPEQPPVGWTPPALAQRPARARTRARETKVLATVDPGGAAPRPPPRRRDLRDRRRRTRPGRHPQGAAGRGLPRHRPARRRRRRQRHPPGPPSHRPAAHRPRSTGLPM